MERNYDRRRRRCWVSEHSPVRAQVLARRLAPHHGLWSHILREVMERTLSLTKRTRLVPRAVSLSHSAILTNRNPPPGGKPYVSTDSDLMRLIPTLGSAKTLYDISIRTPGLINIPVCSAEKAYQTWRKLGGNTKGPNFPCG